MPCQEQRKESAQKMEGCLRDSWEGGSSGETESGLDARFVTLPLSISMKRKVNASGGCEGLVDSRTSLILGPRRLVNNIQKLISAMPLGSEVKCHAPGSLPVSTHKKDLQGQPLSLSLTTLRFMFWDQYPALYYLHYKWHQIPSPSSSLHPQGEGRTLRSGSQIETCRNPWAAAGRRPPSEGHLALLQMQLSPVAGPEPPTT